MRRTIERLDPTVAGNQRLLRQVQKRQANRDLMVRIRLVRLALLLVVPFLAFQLAISLIASLLPFDHRWLSGICFLLVVAGGFWLSLYQLRRGRWQWLISPDHSAVAPVDPSDQD